MNVSRDDLELIKQCLETALSGKEHDNSWIRPRSLSDRQRVACLAMALQTLNTVMEGEENADGNRLV